MSNPILKTFYDKYGESQLKEGFFHKGLLQGGYRFKNNSEQIFQDFYLNYNPFADVIDSTGKNQLGSLFGSAYGG